MLMLPFLKLMADKKASDLFFSCGAPPQIKIDGHTLPVNDKPLSAENVQRLAHSLMSPKQIDEFDRELEMNFGTAVNELGNYRVNIFRQRGSIGIVIRYIAPKIPSLGQLNLPETLKELTSLKRGLIFVVGATGSGKSSTVAAMIEQRNQTQTGHILTVEDPIEFIFEHKRSLVNQREIGVDTHSYQNALKSAMREAPDVLMIGEIRDAETLTHAINYAQSGHLCISTLHGNNSYHALNRIISFFPLENRSALLMDLSAALKAVISQRLIPASDGKRRPALEVLINTSHIADLIRNGEIDKIKEAIEASMTEGAQTFEQSLFRLYRDGLISLEEALHNADSPTNLYWLINHDNSKPEDSKPEDGESFAGFTLSH
ncbi:twitching motility protein PilU [Vogesella indigofera]|uniref:Twitching motility protein PilU n=1 Tax=Vogesella indigofera TaxID=45465 RepID=A0A495B3I3_VOGIN|nr:PilT/PilU family type 4a pilus ATPase [Vogesella indigofera]RKQ55522.1 twitching motility protein PilU [Vogesella indigofera]